MARSISQDGLSERRACCSSRKRCSLPFRTGKGSQTPNRLILPHTAVYTKLSVALSSLSLHLQPKGEWENWLLESTMTLSGTSCSKDAIYELLVIVVEEASRADLVGRAR